MAPLASRRPASIRAEIAARSFGGVLSRAMLGELGVDRHAVRNNVVARRWALHGRWTVATHTLPLSAQARQWRALWEVCGADVALDGVSALLAAGLSGFTQESIDVSVPKASSPPAVADVRIHRVVRVNGEVINSGTPRVRAAVAAIRAAQWAVSDRQAALVVVMTVQQRLATAQQLRQAAELVRGRRRQSLITAVIGDVADGAHSLGELDFAAACRRHGIPAPDRQVVMRGPRGRIYLDARWDSGLVVEIDGAGHRVGTAVTWDNLRQNSVVLQGGTVLRIDVIGLRLEEAAFMAQVRAALRLLDTAAGGSR